MFYQTALQTSTDRGSEHAPGTDNPKPYLINTMATSGPPTQLCGPMGSKSQDTTEVFRWKPPFHWCFINLIPQHLRKAEE